MTYEEAQAQYPCQSDCMAQPLDRILCPNCFVRFLANDPGGFTAHQLYVIHSMYDGNLIRVLKLALGWKNA